MRSCSTGVSERSVASPAAIAKRVARQRPGLIHRPAGCDALHQIAPPAVGRDRQPSADHLPQRGEVRRHAESLSRSAQRDPETGHDFIEDEERARLIGQRAQAGEKILVGRDEAGVPDDRLDDDRGQFAGELPGGRGGRSEIVELER